MGKKIEKKRFQEPQEMIRSIVFLSILSIIQVLLLINFLYLNENELYKMFAEQKLVGGAGQRARILFMKFLVETFGKNGVIYISAILLFIFLVELHSEISAYRRYKYKCKLYQEGVIKNFFDIYDDKPSFSIFGSIRKIFKKKYKHKENLSNKQIEKKMDDYFKKIKGD